MATIIGTEGSDFLSGTSGPDMIEGRGGDDTINGGGGDDTLDGGDGNDSLNGGTGRDVVRGGLGDDRITFSYFGVPTIYDDIDGGDGIDHLTFAGSDALSGITLNLNNPSIEQFVGGVRLINVESVNITSSDGFGDNLTGGAYGDRLNGVGGNDYLDGAGGNDELIGGEGADTMLGGNGDDTLTFDSGDVLVDGGDGIDLGRFIQEFTTINVDFSNPAVDQTIGTTTIRNVERVYIIASGQITGGQYADEIYGWSGNDVLNGGGGDDRIGGNGGVDELRGGAGDDILLTIKGGNVAGDALVDGGSGIDRYEVQIQGYTGDTTIDLTDAGGTIVNIEQISFRGGTGRNTVSGASFDDLLVGGAGMDRFEGRGGADRLIGNGGDDLLFGGDGDDLLEGGGGSDFIYGGEGNDALRDGSAAGDTNLLDGGAGDDELLAGASNDTLIGGSGTDYMSGGRGDDLYDVDNMADQVIEFAGEGYDEIRTSVSDYVLPTHVEKLTYTGSGGVIRGNGGNNKLHGGAGDDVFRLEAGGADAAFGGAGNDGFYFGASYASADVVDGGAGSLDQVGLQGDYSTGVTLGSLVGTELVVLLRGDDARFGGQTGTNLSYNLLATSSTIVSNNTLTIQGNTLRAGENLTFDGSASSIDFLVYAGFGTDTLSGGSGNDGFFFGQGRLGAGDVINGSAGTLDQVGLQGNFSGANAITFGAAQLSGLEFIVLLTASDNRFGASGGTASYDLTTNNANVSAGQRLIIQGNTLGASETLVFRGLDETDGNFSIFSGAGNDTLVGGQLDDIIFGRAGNDFIEGQGGADQLTGGAGNDSFHYLQASESTNAARDQILDFATGDTIDLAGLAANTGGAGFAFIGGGVPTDSRQLQVIQTGNAATVNVYIDGDAIADLVIDVTVADGHTLTSADFAGTVAQDADPVKLAASNELSALFREDAGGLDPAGTTGSTGKHLEMALAEDFGGPDFVHVSNDLHLLSTSYDLVA